MASRDPSQRLVWWRGGPHNKPLFLRGLRSLPHDRGPISQARAYFGTNGHPAQPHPSKRGSWLAERGRAANDTGERAGFED